jgi:CRISPR-associated exonuclease Cas4
VTPTENPKSQIANPGEREALPLSLLNDFLYCPRRAALKVVEGWREANVHTERGDIVHEHSDLPGYEVVKGVTLWRALPVWSERRGLSGKCDIVEAHFKPVGDEGTSPPSTTHPEPRASHQKNEPPHVGSYNALFPIEFKLGKRRQWENDDAQLSKRRRDVEFTPELRKITEEAVDALHALLGGFDISSLESEIPPLPAAVFKPACAECSLFDICLPAVIASPARAARAAHQLFEI